MYDVALLRTHSLLANDSICLKAGGGGGWGTVAAGAMVRRRLPWVRHVSTTPPSSMMLCVLCFVKVTEENTLPCRQKYHNDSYSVRYLRTLWSTTKLAAGNYCHHQKIISVSSYIRAVVVVTPTFEFRYLARNQ